jgi:hypothetical protein
MRNPVASRYRHDENPEPPIAILEGMIRYWVEGSELWSANESGILWRGRPDGRPVRCVVRLGGTDDCAVLLDPDAGPRNPLRDLLGWPNLVRVGPAGTIAWRAAASESESDRDWWVAIDAVGDMLFGNTWSCYRKRLDPNTGHVLSAVFVK